MILFSQSLENVIFWFFSRSLENLPGSAEAERHYTYDIHVYAIHLDHKTPCILLCNTCFHSTCSITIFNIHFFDPWFRLRFQTWWWCDAILIRVITVMSFVFWGFDKLKRLFTCFFKYEKRPKSWYNDEEEKKSKCSMTSNIFSWYKQTYTHQGKQHIVIWRL